MAGSGQAVRPKKRTLKTSYRERRHQISAKAMRHAENAGRHRWGLAHRCGWMAFSIGRKPANERRSRECCMSYVSSKRIDNSISQPIKNWQCKSREKKERGRYANRPMHEPGTGSKRSSEQGHRADALALGADERRDKLRKAAVRSKYPLTRRSLNGETPLDRLQRLCSKSIAAWREPGELKHLSSRRKRKKHRFPE